MSRPVVFFHGFTGSPEAWTGVIRHLELPPGSFASALLGHAPDLVRGPETCFDDELERLARAIGRGQAPVDLVGYSLGARTALGLLCRHPERVARALLIGVHPGLDDAGDRAARIRSDEKWIERLETEPLETFVDAWQALSLFSTQSRLEPRVLEAQRAERLGHDPRGLSRSLRVMGLGVMPSWWDALASLSDRVHLAVGEHDEKFRRLAGRARARAGVPVTVVPGAGHNVVLERPDAVSALVSEVLS